MVVTEKRFLAKVLVGDECWSWVGARTSNGYGNFWDGQHYVGAHRYAYQLFVGLIPDGLGLDHLCRVRECVRPSHLEPVTQKENVRRGAHVALITHCPSGHAYDLVNTYIGSKGERQCRVCSRQSSRERWRRQHWEGYGNRPV